MKKLLYAAFFAAALPLLCSSIFGQNRNPQPNFATAVAAAQPSTWLRFNGSSASSYQDIAGGLTFSGVNYLITGPTSVTSQGGANFAVVNLPAVSVSGAIQSVELKHFSAPTSACTIHMVIASGTAPSFTIVDSFSITMPANIANPKFVAGVDFPTGHTISSGQFIGTWADSTVCSQTSGNGTSSGGGYFFGSSTLPAGAHTYTVTASTQAININVATGNGFSPNQAGFDAAQANNFSVAIPQNGSIAAPNETAGDFEWSSPWTMLYHIDRFNYDRSGVLTLASKGDTNTANLKAFWSLIVQMNGSSSQLCFNMQAPTPGIGGSNIVDLDICTLPAFDALPNGFNYDIAVTNDGGGWTSDFTIWINGIPVGGSIPGNNTAQFNTGFNPAVITITSGGTGYAAITNFTSTGGGPDCVVTGHFGSSGGVINGMMITRTSGCTSAPTIVLTAPTGTGATFSTTAFTSTLSTATTNPVYVGGPTGFSADSGQAASDVDEVAFFNTTLTDAQITNIFYWTQFFQTGNGLSATPPASPPVLFIDNDPIDPDNEFALAAAIGMDLRGYLKLEGINEDVGDQVCEQMWQQMLDQAGLAHVPLTTSASSAASSPSCFTSDINTYNASTPHPALNTATALYRTVFANNPTRPIYVQLTGQWTGMSLFMQSPPDGISSLTGQQLLDRNAANGGAIFAQGMECLPTTNYVPTPCSATITGDNSLVDAVAGQYVVNHNGATPIYFYGGSPTSTGPGTQWGRVAKDPLLLYGTSHTFVRQAFDSLPLTGMITPTFSRGVFLTVSGGTGYATLTPFNSTGGGSNCNVQGYMVSSGGVPTGFETQWQSTQDTFSGIGYGCTSTPTINLIGATGTGATITPAQTAVCGTVTITTGGTPTATVSSATCSNHYFLPYSPFAAGTGVGSTAPAFSMFLNSFIDQPPTGQPRVQQQ